MIAYAVIVVALVTICLCYKRLKRIAVRLAGVLSIEIEMDDPREPPKNEE